MLDRLLLCFGILAILSASAHAEDKEKAREVSRLAAQHYELGEYRQALDGFEQAPALRCRAASPSRACCATRAASCSR